MTSPLDRETVVRIAGDLADEHGLAAVTLKNIARRAHVTQPALYRHVEGIDDVWRELALSVRAELTDEMVAASVGLSGDSAVAAVAHAWRDFGRENPGRYRSTERATVSGDHDLETAVQRVLDVLGLALRGYGLDDDEAAHAARLLRSALHGFVSFELGDGHPLTPPIDATFDRLIALLSSGFSATRDTTRP